MRPSLARLTLRGFKTIRELQDFEPGRLTLLIGPNGAGKTNFISFFRLLSHMLTSPGELQSYVTLQGGASTLLHDGPRITRAIEAELDIEVAPKKVAYSFELSHASGDTLVFLDEYFELRGHAGLNTAVRSRLAHRESELLSDAEHGADRARFMIDTLARMFVYQFHDTSPTSRVRNKWPVDDGRSLKEDAANLASFLYRLRESETKYYQRVVETIRLVLPFFADFEFQPEHGSLLLRWRERGSDQVFNASQAADGMLRVMALVALLAQPEHELPAVLILDEPELGLHPYAIEVLAALIQSASQHAQVIVATQSVSLVDRFEPHDIVVVDRERRESKFKRLNDSELAEWREQYTMSELWEKNVFGGGPSR
jgi:predicted ATPase